MDEVSTLVIGAGPGGLACAYALAEAGERPVVVERAAEVGGLMRNVDWNDFSVDLGRKELYSRIEEVDQLWSNLLKEDYIPYEHREGILFKGQILETSSQHRALRGFPLPLALRCAVDMGLALLAKPFRTPRNYEAYWYAQRGRTLSRVLSQGYEEKFNGTPWADMPVPYKTDGETARSAAAAGHSNPRLWRHPALGSGQIPRALAAGIVAKGGRIELSTDVSSLDVYDGNVRSIVTSNRTGEVVYRARNVVSSLPAPVLARLLNIRVNPTAHSAMEVPTRGTVLVYLYANTPPRFPHNWLRVTCPELRAGRIVNYASFGGRMVPAGKSCLCVEFFCTGNDALLEMDDAQLKRLAINECESAQLFYGKDCTGSLVLKLPMADAATSWRDWRTPLRTKLAETVADFKNLLDIGRPGTDKATAAGLFAARAIIQRNSSVFTQLIEAIDGPIAE